MSISSSATCASHELDGKQAEDRLHSIGITVNRNAVPFDPRPPAVSSGLRIGTPALATRGLQVEDFVEVGMIIAEALNADGFEDRQAELSERAAAIAERYPLYRGSAPPRSSRFVSSPAHGALRGRRRSRSWRVCKASVPIQARTAVGAAGGSILAGASP